MSDKEEEEGRVALALEENGERPSATETSLSFFLHSKASLSRQREPRSFPFVLPSQFGV